ncbi:MAG: DUF3352 domain-containing protein [Tannerellaceae bacterium]|nr:DUF3352 domain-containing protein [Tannerellaceae bacterium]
MIYLSPDNTIRQIYLVPKDAAVIIQTSEPVKDWKKFSGSEPWKALKQAQAFDEIAQQVESMDSVLHSNKNLLSLVGKRDMLISLHKTRAKDWDALMIIDLQKASKMELLKSQMETLIKMSGSQVSNRQYKDFTILEMKDTETNESLHITFIDNHVVASYTLRLVEAAINERENPYIGMQPTYLEAETQVEGKGLCRFYINYQYIPSFMSIYMDEKNEYMELFSNSMDFAGLYFHADKEKMEVKGYTYKKENADPYIDALLNSGKHKMKAHEILSARTAFYTNIGFENPARFVKELESIMAEKDEKEYKNYASSRKKLESFFGISLEENFLNWMSGEFAISQSEPLLGQEPDFILAIRAKNIKDARKNMDLIEKKIKGRTPISIKSVTYKKHDIKYVEMKGFFRLFFGGMFDKFEKPYYTYMDDYVIFSNKPGAILALIEDYNQKFLLKNNPGFKKTYSHYPSQSTLFLYADIQKFYPMLENMLDAPTKKSMRENQSVLFSFPYWSMQMIGDQESASLHYIMDYKPFEELTPEELPEDFDENDKALSEDATTEKELMSELKRFHVEKFQGSILREFYPEGAIRSESETRNGKLHGRHREYYENGSLKLRGKHHAGRKAGTWKFYTEDGKFDRKEKFK